jgi:hypothetical protein
MCFDIVRLQFQCPTVAGDRFVQLPLVLQRIAQVVVGTDIVRLQYQCPAVAGDRFVQLTHLVGDHAEKMERIDIIWFGLQNLPIDLLGSLEPTALMVLDRNRQSFGNRCHDINYSHPICQPQLVSTGIPGRMSLALPFPFLHPRGMIDN